MKCRYVTAFKTAIKTFVSLKCIQVEETIVIFNNFIITVVSFILFYKLFENLYT